MSHGTDLAQAWGSILAGLSNCAILYVVFRTAQSWRSSLANQNADRAVERALFYRSAVGRAKSALERPDQDSFWGEYDRAHRSLTELEAALHVAGRYYDDARAISCRAARQGLHDLGAAAKVRFDAGEGAWPDMSQDLVRAETLRTHTLSAVEQPQRSTWDRFLRWVGIRWQ